MVSESSLNSCLLSYRVYLFPFGQKLCGSAALPVFSTMIYEVNGTHPVVVFLALVTTALSHFMLALPRIRFRYGLALRKINIFLDHINTFLLRDCVDHVILYYRWRRYFSGRVTKKVHGEKDGNRGDLCLAI